MKKLTTALLGLSALALPATASASVTLTFGATTPIPANNNFQADLAALGLTQMATVGAGVFLNVNAPLRFDFLGSESSFNDTITAGTVTFTEMTLLTNNFPAGVNLGSSFFTAGPLAGDINFTSSGNALVGTIGLDSVALLLGPAAVSGQTSNVFFLGFDDQVTATDDNHDDFIVRVTVLPEPGTWAMMLLGFGAVGFAIRRARRTPALPQLA